MAKRAEEERELLQPNMREMKLPSRKALKKPAGKKGQGSGGGGGGFAKGAVVRTAAQQHHDLCADTVHDDGVCMVKSVLGKDSAARMYECLADELERAYAAVEDDATVCPQRFNVPHATFDKKRGYLLLPLRDEASERAGTAKDGPLVSALRELLTPGATLGELFQSTCGGVADEVELFDIVGLRTEAGASRQCIHSDTPYQKVPGLFCAFIALTDVRYEQGTTVFLPGTHKGSKGARGQFDRGQLDRNADEMLRNHPSRYTSLKAGDAVFFNMNTLHAGQANMELEEGGGQRLLFILTFRNPKATAELGHLPNLRLAYRDRGPTQGLMTLADMQRELAGDDPFAGDHRDGKPYGDGLLLATSA